MPPVLNAASCMISYEQSNILFAGQAGESNTGHEAPRLRQALGNGV
jgi:hypothetical protein